MKIILVSFFLSDNLGDIMLSNAIEALLLNKYDATISKYDFLTFHKITDGNKGMIGIQNPSNRNTLDNIAKKFIKKILPEFTVTLANYKLKSLLSNKHKEFEEDLKGADHLIIAGGNMLMDLTPVWPDILKTYTDLAVKAQKKYSIHFVGAGPIYHNRTKRMLRKILEKAHTLSVRGSHSKKQLEEIGIKRSIEQTVDPVFSLELEKKDLRIDIIKEVTAGRKKRIGICVIGKVCFSNLRDFDLYMDTLIRYILEYGKIHDVTLFSTEKMDYEAIKFIVDNTNTSVRVIEIDSLKGLIELYDTLEFLIGGRMHSLIFAQKSLLPFIGVVWQNKILEFSKIVRAEEHVYDVHSFAKLEFNRIIEDNITDLCRIEVMNDINKNLKIKVIETVKEII